MTLDEAINKWAEMAKFQERFLSDTNDRLNETIMEFVTEYRQLAEWLRELKERRGGGWISCKERMPEDMKSVLCLKTDGKCAVMRKEPGNRYWQTDFRHIFRDDLITHWQPLPELPEGGAD